MLFFSNQLENIFDRQQNNGLVYSESEMEKLMSYFSQFNEAYCAPVNDLLEMTMQLVGNTSHHTLSLIQANGKKITPERFIKLFDEMLNIIEAHENQLNKYQPSSLGFQILRSSLDYCKDSLKQHTEVISKKYPLFAETLVKHPLNEFIHSKKTGNELNKI